MDKINVNINTTKRVHSIGVSQSMNIEKLVQEFIDENKIPEDDVKKLYIGFDSQYMECLGFDLHFLDYFKMEMTSPLEMHYTMIKDLPDTKLLIVLVDTYLEDEITEALLSNVSVNTHILYIFDNLLTDYTNDGGFMKRFINPECVVNTYNRRPDIKAGINILLNKIKKSSTSFLTANDLASDTNDTVISFEALKDEELLDYDKIIVLNDDDTSEFNIRIRNLLSRGFLPEPRDKMINYTPIEVINVNSENLERVNIPIYSDLRVIQRVSEPDGFVPPIYQFEYIDHHGNSVIFDDIVNTSFIDNMNCNKVEHKDLSFIGIKVYYSYCIPLYAAQKRYEKIALIITNFILSKSVLYTGIRFARSSFRISYENNTYIS